MSKQLIVINNKITPKSIFELSEARPHQRPESGKARWKLIAITSVGRLPNRGGQVLIKLINMHQSQKIIDHGTRPLIYYRSVIIIHTPKNLNDNSKDNYGLGFC